MFRVPGAPAETVKEEKEELGLVGKHARGP